MMEANEVKESYILSFIQVSKGAEYKFGEIIFSLNPQIDNKTLEEF